MVRKLCIFLALCLVLTSFSAVSASENISADAVNRAASVSEVKQIIKTQTDGVFYPDEIFAYLIGRDFENEAEIEAELSMRRQSAQTAPKIALLCDGKAVAKPEKGVLSVKLAPFFKKDITAVAALYDGGRLIGLDAKEVNETAETVLSPGISSDTSECKVLFFDSFTAASPTDFYGASKLSVYLSENGNDETGIGTKKRPFRTIEKAKQYANTVKQYADSDVNVTFLPGTYAVTEPVHFGVSDSGYGDYDIVYRGEPGAKLPLISGGVKVENTWQPYENSIFRVSVPGIAEARQMYINGIPAQRSVTKGTYIATEKYQKPGSAYAEDGFSIFDCNLPEVSAPSEMEMVVQIKWVTQRVPVENMWKEGYTTYFTMDQPMYDSYVSAICSGGIQPVAGCKVYFENALEFTDEPGEFYFDKDEHMLYYYPFAEENLETAEVFLPKSEGVIDVSGTDTANRVKNLRFSHLDIRHGAWNEISQNGFCSFQADCRLEYDVHAVSADKRGLIPLAQIGINYADNITVSDCRISNVGSTGIGMHNSASNCTVQRNAIHDISGTGVSVGSWRYGASTDPRTLCENITVQNNYITRIGQEYMGSLGLGVYIAKNVSFLHNDIKNVPYTGISAGWNWHSGMIGEYEYGGHVIHGNRIDNVCMERKDGGQIYTLGYLGDSEISENYIIESKDNGGIYLDSGSAYVRVEGNVAERCNCWLFLGLTSGKGSVISGNYSDMDNHRVIDGNQEDYVLEHTQIAADAAWSGESAEIAAASGIETALRNTVLSPVSYPSWRKSLYGYIPKSENLAAGEYLVEAEDYLNEPGGYYKKDGKAPVVYAQAKNTVVGNFFASEWLKYNVTVEKAGTYRLDIRSGSGPDPMAKPCLVTIEVNDVPVIQKAEHALTPAPWEDCVNTVLGEIELNAGLNTIKVINEQNGWSYDNLKLTLME